MTMQLNFDIRHAHTAVCSALPICYNVVGVYSFGPGAFFSSEAAVELVGHLAVDALGAEMGGATVLAAHRIVIGQSQAIPGPAPQQTHGQGEAEARQE